MIILDTNILSEFMGTPPAGSVQAWLNLQNADALRITAISIAEIRLGLRLMPPGRRQRLLAEDFDTMRALAISRPALPFDDAAAEAYGELRARRSAAGRPIGVLDAQIAGIARSRAAAIATRNVRDFTGCGIEVINPFDFGIE